MSADDKTHGGKPPSERRVIQIVDQNGYEELAHLMGDKGTNHLLTPELHVLNTNDLSKEDYIRNLEAMDLLRNENVLIQNPYRPDRYFPIKTAQIDTALEKYHLFVEFCDLLGATSVSVEEWEASTKKGKTVGSFKGGKAKVGGSGSVERNSVKKLEQELMLTARFNGSEAGV